MNNDHSPPPVNTPIVPGNATYSDAVTGINKATIFSTSMCRDFNLEKLKTNCKSRVTLTKFNGKLAKHFKTYVTAHMPEDSPDVVVIQAGGNDLRTKERPVEIAKSIIEAGIVCKNLGATKVLISSVLPRSDFHLQLKRHDVNQLLQGLCEIHNFIYIPNDFMKLSEHISYDGVHLNESGTVLLQNTFTQYLNLNA